MHMLLLPLQGIPFLLKKFLNLQNICYNALINSRLQFAENC